MAFYSPLNGVGARDATASKTNAVWMKREGNQVNDENEITECTTHLSDQFCPEKPNVYISTTPFSDLSCSKNVT